MKALIYKMKQIVLTLAALVLISSVAAWGGEREPPTHAVPPGAPESAKTEVLSAGAKLLQTHSPLSDFNVYLVGFHPMKNNPSLQLEAHHYCKLVNQDFMQCILFDGNTPSANLNGIEYIISEKLFNTLSPEEKHYWHPHNYEILSGELVAPHLPESAQQALMKTKVNSYGKTWHVWDTGAYGRPGDKLPLGKPMLAWSFNHDGEVDPGLITSRDKAMGIDTREVRRRRQKLVPLAHPQMGVDAIEEDFHRPTTSIPGVKNEPYPSGDQ